MLQDSSWFARFMVILGYFMVAVYIVLGCLLFFPQVYPSIPKNLKIVFALFFISYGLFRLARIVSKKRESNKEGGIDEKE